MITWLLANLATILICLVLLIIVSGVIAVLVRDKRNKTCSCGGSCGHCPMGDSCHKH